jgi:hypothetical protein
VVKIARRISGIANHLRLIRGFIIPFVGCLQLMPMLAPADPVAGSAATLADGFQASVLSAKFLDTNEAVIGAIRIDADNIFDLDDPRENNWLYRTANAIHVTTRPDEIQNQLLFESGETYSARAMEESERILRGNRYLHDATIVPVRYETGVVDIAVRTQDTWSLVPELDFSRKGGANDTSVGIKEINLLGTGMELELAYESGIDRDSKFLKVVDRHLGGSWYGLDLIYGDNSDGHTRILNLQKPFYSLNTTLAGGVFYLDNDQIDTVYEGGELYGQYRHRANAYELRVGWSNGLIGGWTRRFTTGLRYDQHDFESVDARVAPAMVPPEDRLLASPFFGVELLQDKFSKGMNFDQIGRTEDRYFGTRLAARVGFAGESLGSDRNAWLFDALAQTAFGKPEASTLFLSAKLDGRWESAGLRNLIGRIGAKYYKRQSDKRLFFARIDALYGQNLDVDSQLLLGGDNGLRGYPHHYVSGDKSVLLTLEQRIFTDWYPFRLFHVGAAAFFDAGRTWGPSLSGLENPGLLKDIGVGMRLGNSRSGQGNTIHVDLAFPLDGGDNIDGMQLLIETKKSF